MSSDLMPTVGKAKGGGRIAAERGEASAWTKREGLCWPGTQKAGSQAQPGSKPGSKVTAVTVAGGVAIAHSGGALSPALSEGVHNAGAAVEAGVGFRAEQAPLHIHTTLPNIHNQFTCYKL